MKAVWKTIRWLVAVLVLGGNFKLFLDTLGHVPGPTSVGLPFWFWYGNWRGFLSVAATSILFLLAFTLPRRKVEWRNAGLFAAFFISLFFEMYGLPLTIFVLAPLLDVPIWIFGHMESHLWAFALAWLGILPLYLGTYAVMVASMGLITMGVGLVAIGWATIYRRRKVLVTHGIYSLIRHPQYLGLILIILAFNIQWPTLPTLLMSPVLIVLYMRQARREDKELEVAFRQELVDYTRRVPAFLPFRRASTQRGAMRPSAISFLLFVFYSVFLFSATPALGKGARLEILRDLGFRRSEERFGIYEGVK